MDDIEVIVLRSGLPPEETARMLAATLHAATGRTDSGAISMSRPTAPDPARSVTGEVAENDYAGDGHLYDHYDTVVELWLDGAYDPALLHAEARRMFDELTAALPWPAAHTNLTGRLYAAWSPTHGRTDFPPGTRDDGMSRAAWQPYAPQ